MKIKNLFIKLVKKDYYSERCSANSSAFSCRFFAHVPGGGGGVEYLLVGGDVVLGFLQYFIGFQNELSSLFETRDVFFKRLISI
jgi:hypothetical protein